MSDKLNIIRQSRNFVMVGCEKQAKKPIHGDNAVEQLGDIWLTFFERLRAEGLRPVQQFHRPMAIVCEVADAEVWGMSDQNPRVQRAA